MPEPAPLRWRTADGRTGVVGASRAPRSGPTRRQGGPAPSRTVRAAAPAPAPDPLAPLRARLRLPATASADQVVAAAAAALAPPAPAPVAPAPGAAYVPLVAATGPTEADLVEEAEWEATNSRLFGIPDGPATRALAERGLPSVRDRQVDAEAQRQQATEDAFARAAEADRLAEVGRIDASRAGRAQVSAAARQQVQDAADAWLFPELRRP